MTERSQVPGVEDVERGRVQADELSWALRAVVLATAEADRALARQLALRPLDYVALNHVMTSRHPLGPAELSERLGISTGSATELVDRLETTGHLRRDQHPTDRRRVSLTPTDTAISAVLDSLAPLFGDLDSLALDFTRKEQDTIRRFLRAAEQRLHHYAATTHATSSRRSAPADVEE
ncbi:MAG: MarR family winged helix-turn-helix transcriptional regulator [Phycicoccus sp.]